MSPARGLKEHTMAQLPTYPDGRLRKFTDVGSYPLFYRTQRGHDLCCACAQEAEDEDDCFDPPIAAEVNWESDISCDGCSAEIERAYGSSSEDEADVE